MNVEEESKYFSNETKRDKGDREGIPHKHLIP